MSSSKRVLVAPLNWGLGHATRCIPIIQELQKQGAEVLIASDGRALELLKEEFSHLPFFKLPAYNIHYPFRSMILSIGFQLPKIIGAIWKEKRAIQKLIEKEKIDIIISDNRFGCYSKKVKSIFLTHQINIKTPFRLLDKLVAIGNHFWIKKFHKCWIPDFEGNGSLAGELSQKSGNFYVGILSRMKRIEVEKKYDIIIVLSGPEPQRTILEKEILLQIKNLPFQFLLIQGKTEQKIKTVISNNIEMISFLTSRELNQAILEAEIVICRSGYSSLMDLAKLQKKAILIPTPGQTEQEYLAQRFLEEGVFYAQIQSKLDLKTALREVQNYSGFNNRDYPNDLLECAISELLK